MYAAHYWLLTETSNANTPVMNHFGIAVGLQQLIPIAASLLCKSQSRVRQHKEGMSSLAFAQARIHVKLELFFLLPTRGGILRDH